MLDNIEDFDAELFFKGINAFEELRVELGLSNKDVDLEFINNMKENTIKLEGEIKDEVTRLLNLLEGKIS